MKDVIKISGLLSLLSIFIFAPTASAMTFTTTPSDRQGWKAYTAGGGSITYVDAPAVGDGFGASALQLRTENNLDSQAGYYHEVDKAFSALPAISYMAKTISANVPVPDATQSNPGGSAGMALFTDLNGDGAYDTTLVYEPYLSDGLSDNAPVVPNEWKTWDVLQGSVWSSKMYDSAAMKTEKGTGGSVLYKLSDVLAKYTSAKLVGAAINVGTYNPNYTVNIDAVTIGDRVYDFQRQAEGSVAKNECKNFGWKELDSVEGQRFKNQGACVSYFAPEVR